MQCCDNEAKLRGEGFVCLLRLLEALAFSSTTGRAAAAGTVIELPDGHASHLVGRSSDLFRKPGLALCTGSLPGRLRGLPASA